jgi:hemoglobin
MAESSLYERLGGAFAIAAVIDHFSDAVVRNPIAGQQSENPELQEWSTNDLARLPGLKFMRTLSRVPQFVVTRLREFGG